MAFPADINGFIVNKVKVNTGTTIDNCFNKGNISIGVSTDYGSYGESCYTGWYQGMWNTSGSTVLDDTTRLMVFSRKSPGGSLFFGTNKAIRINDDSDDLTLNQQKFTIEFWFKNFTPTNDYLIFGNVSSGDTTGIAFIYKNSNNSLIVRAGDDVSNWNVIDYTSSTLSSAWHHVCLQRDIVGSNYTNALYIDGVVVYSGTSQRPIVSPNKKYSIGSYLGGGSYASCFLTNLRVLIGMAKYPINGFVVPIYPISALGKSGGTICSKLMLNVRQPNSYINNSGYSSITFAPLSTYPNYDTSTPFLLDIPAIYKTPKNQLLNVVKSINNNFSGTTGQEALLETVSNNNIMLQNFVYPEIPTSGLQLCLDSGHISSWPNQTAGVNNNFNKWYSLISNSKFANLNTGLTVNNNVSGNTYFTTSNTIVENILISGLTIPESFTLLLFADTKTIDVGYFFNTGQPENGVLISQNSTNLVFSLADSLGVVNYLEIISNQPTLNQVLCYGIGYDAASTTTLASLNNNYITTIQGVARGTTTFDSTIIAQSIRKDVYAVLLYDRLLSTTEIDSIRNAYSSRLLNQ